MHLSLWSSSVCFEQRAGEESSSVNQCTKCFFGRESLTFDWFGGGPRTGQFEDESLHSNSYLKSFSIHRERYFSHQYTAMHKLFSITNLAINLYIYLTANFTSSPVSP